MGFGDFPDRSVGGAQLRDWRICARSREDVGITTGHSGRHPLATHHRTTNVQIASGQEWGGECRSISKTAAQRDCDSGPSPACKKTVKEFGNILLGKVNPDGFQVPPSTRVACFLSPRSNLGGREIISNR